MSDTVEIADVERELSRLWREAAQSGQAASPRPAGETRAPAIMRACALNLVVAGCGGEQEGLAGILLEATARHPCRAILVLTEEEAAPGPGADHAGPRAWVSMMCHPGGRGQPQVCSEQIVVTAPPAARHELVASVAGLLVADLPTFLWWRGRLPESALERERFEHLADVADRLLFDSLRYDAAQLTRAVELARTYHRLPFGDLNWARLTSWRGAVAQCFDPPVAQALLAHLERARIFYYSEPVAPGPPAAGRLLGGWLRSRLQRSLPIELVAGDADLLELYAAEACFRVARPPAATDSAALSEELRLLGRDLVFEQALEAATRLVDDR